MEHAIIYCLTITHFYIVLSADFVDEIFDYFNVSAERPNRTNKSNICIFLK